MDELDFPSVEHENRNYVYGGTLNNTLEKQNIKSPSMPPKRKVTSARSSSSLSKEEKERLRKKRYHKALAKGLIKRCSTFVAISLTIGIAINKMNKKDRAATITDQTKESEEKVLVLEDSPVKLSEGIENIPELNEKEDIDLEISEEEYNEFANEIEGQFDSYYTYQQETFDDDYITDDVSLYKEINANIDAYAVRYCEQIVYDKIMNLFKPYIETYSNMYGVDPNYIASLIMVEVPDYEFEKDTDKTAIGVGQYKGHLFEGDTFKAYNYETKEYDSYVFNSDELLKNPKLQIKVLCMDVARVAKEYDYNLYAMLEHHNKGCGSVSDALEILRNRYNLSNNKEVLNIVDPTEITEVINKIGDPNYTSKAMTYMNMCLEQNAFKKDTISFERENGKDPVYININVNTYNRS